jgi:hypothetical protein
MATNGDCCCVWHNRAPLQGPAELAQGLSHETGLVGILCATDGCRALEHLPVRQLRIWSRRCKARRCKMPHKQTSCSRACGGAHKRGTGTARRLAHPAEQPLLPLRARRGESVRVAVFVLLRSNAARCVRVPALDGDAPSEPYTLCSSSDGSLPETSRVALVCAMPSSFAEGLPRTASCSPPRPALQLLTPESLFLLRPAPPTPRRRPVPTSCQGLHLSREHISPRSPISFAATHGIVNPHVCCRPPTSARRAHCALAHVHPISPARPPTMADCAPSFGPCTAGRRPQPASKHQKQPRVSRTSLAVAILAATLPAAAAQSCVSLQGSTTCPAFSNASISTSIGDLYV